MRKWLPVGLKIIISLLILLVIFISVDFNELKAAFANIDYKYLIYILPLLALSIFTRIYRWRYLINLRQQKTVSLGMAAKITLAGVALSIFMPAQSGEVFKSYYGYKWSGIKERMISVSLYDKLIAIASVGLLGLIPAILYADFWFLTGAIIAFIPFLTINFIIKSKLSAGFWNKFFKKFFKEKINYELIKTHFRFKFPEVFFTIILSSLTWILTYRILWLSFISISSIEDVIPSFTFVIMTAPLLTLVRLFPFTLNGLGTDEAAIVILFGISGTDAVIALSAALIYKIITMFIPGLIGLIIILINKQGTKKI